VARSTIRASDADRDAVTERLQQAAVEGRLEHWELEERLGAALRARTYGDLDRVLRDLPGTPRGSRSVARVSFALVLRVAVVLAIVSAIVVAAVVTAAWWIVCAIVWLTLRGGRSCRPRGTLHRRRPAHPY
jgi:Flp pilus assembly protein TadB